MNEINREIAELKPTKLAELLSRCTEKEQEFFHLIFPNGPNDEQFNGVVSLIEQTLKENSVEPDAGGGGEDG